MAALEQFAVKSNIPIRRARSVYPFEAMNIGDSFDAPDDMGSVEGYKTKSARRHSILASARNYAARSNRHFKITTSLLIDDRRQIVRVWRTA